MDAKFNTETIVDLPRETVVDLYTDIQYFSHWQQNFVAHKYLSDPDEGELEVAEVTYNFEGNSVTFIRKVLKMDLPEVIVSTFEINGIREIVETKFVAISARQTKILVEVVISTESAVVQADFVKLTEAFRIQTAAMQQSFKRFAESH